MPTSKNSTVKSSNGIPILNSSASVGTGTSNVPPTTTTQATTTISTGSQSAASPSIITGGSSEEITAGAKRLASELTEFLVAHPELQTESTVSAYPVLLLSEKGSIGDLQLATCRKLRELLPNSKELLQTAQQRNWIPLLLSWLNLRDRPAVQVEALLALTSIAELCAQQQPCFSPTASTTNVVKAAKAAVSAVQGNSWNDAMQAAQQYAAAAANSAAAYAGVGIPPYNAPGSVPFPPLSFSETLSPEAVAALDASLTQTLNSLGNSNNATKTNPNWSLPPAPLFPTTALPPPSGAPLSVNTGALGNSMPGSGGINFTSLAPPPGGAHNSIGPHPTNAFLPPPTPVATLGTGSQLSAGLSFPQQLSASSQHLLLRHQDAIPTLITLLSSPNREVYEQAMWILGSIAAGDSPGGSSTSSNSAAAAAATGGAPGTFEKSVSARDVIIAAGVMNQLLRCLEAHPNNLSLQRIGAWTLSNLVDGIFQQSNHKGNAGSTNGTVGSGSSASTAGAGGGHHHHHHSHSYPHNTGTNSSHSSSSKQPTSEYSSADEIDMRTLLPVLRRLLRSTDSEVISYTCWTLSHLCDGPASHIAAVVTTPPNLKNAKPGGLVPRLVELLSHLSWRVTKPALRTIGNIVCAECTDDSAAVGINGGTTTDYTEVILECNAVPKLKELITHTNREIQKEACWTLSNIAAGTVDQIQAVIDAGCIPPLVQLVQDPKTDQEVRSEACWVVLNATSCGSDAQIEGLVDEGCVSVLGVLLSEASMVMMALEGLERVLQVEETREIIRREQIETGEIAEDDDENGTRTPSLVSAVLIEKARESHNNSAVTKRADRIWKQHFVSCALCKKSFSRHRTSDASFCEECKCHVCSNCNCRIYHLDYQEELWAATEERAEVKKNAKKSKNKKKKEKLKQKRAKQHQDPVPDLPEIHLSTPGIPKQPHPAQDDTTKVKVGEKHGGKIPKDGNVTSLHVKKATGPSPNISFDDDDAEDLDVMDNENENDSQNQIDFVLYLQQTGSIIALAKLMDALEYGGDDYDEELDDYERKMIREQQQLLRQQNQHAMQ